MTAVSDLMNRIDAEFDRAFQRGEQYRAEKVEEFQGRQQRLEQLEKTLDQLREIWRPRLEALAKKFGERVDVRPQLEPGRRSATFEFQSDLARIKLRFGVVPDTEVRNLVFNYDLEIIPILMKFESHEELELPLDAIDQTALAKWFDDRIVGFVQTYLSLHENQYYLKDHLVEDPVAKVRFPKYAAGATLELNGKTIYFIDETTLREFEQRQAKDATKPKVDADSKLKRGDYEAELRRLQGELCTLQEWVKAKGLRVIVVFEGRDGAGKGGTIRAITERVSPRVFRVVALPAPSDREKSQMYMQRYMQHFPAAGEIVIFDRSWYNRAGVEHVMGFCTDKQYRKFLERCPEIEKYIVDGGIHLLKYWLEVSNEEQEQRFLARIKDPLRQWKLSPMDLPSRTRWYDYSRARDAMLEATDTKHAPWHILCSDDKKRARLNCISHLLSQIPYEKLPREEVALPNRSKKGAYDDQHTLKGRRFVPEKY